MNKCIFFELKLQHQFILLEATIDHENNSFKYKTFFTNLFRKCSIFMKKNSQVNIIKAKSSVILFERSCHNKYNIAIRFFLDA